MFSFLTGMVVEWSYTFVKMHWVIHGRFMHFSCVYDLTQFKKLKKV